MHTMRQILLILGFFLCGTALQAGQIQYQLRFTEPQAHYADVDILVKEWAGGDMEVSMPVWAPGSYLVREFARMVEDIKAVDLKNNKFLAVQKVNKNTWRVKGGKSSGIKVSYRVYAFELTVRTSFIDQEHAYLNGTSIFMRVNGKENLEHRVTVTPYPDWKIMSVALDRVSESDPWQVSASDYDALADAPFEIGNHLVFSFTAAGVPHEVAMVGDGNYEVERMKKDMAKVVEECTAIFGEHPCKRYVFIVHNLTNGGGGLEHMNSTTVQTNRWSYNSESAYAGFMSLLAHEYFHLWNVKRLRPQPLGPFNYDTENYTTLLWVAEGFTAYYDDLIATRCGFNTGKEYLKMLAGNFSYTANIRGGAYQSLSESSFDAWIKFYRSHENSSNSTVSYYTKGAAMGAVLDLLIRQATNGQASLDLVMQEMYRLYFKKLNRGYTQQELLKMINQVSGKDFTSFFSDYIDGVKVYPFADLLKQTGLLLSDLNAKQPVTYTGINTTMSGGKLTVASVDRGSPAWVAGVNVNDELIAFDQYRLGDDLSKWVTMKAPGYRVKLLISRAGYMKNIDLVLAAGPFVKYTLDWEAELTEQQKKISRGWLTTRKE